MKRENVVEIAKISKNEKSFLRKYEVIQKIKNFEKMKEKFVYVYGLYGLTIISLFTRIKPVAMFLSIVALFATLFIVIAYMVNKYNKKCLINEMNKNEIDFYLDDKDKFKEFIYNPINFLDEYFYEIDHEYLNMAVLYFNTKLSIEPNNSIYLSYLRKIYKRVEDIKKKDLENKIILNKIYKSDESLVSHIDISECNLTEEEMEEIKLLKEKDETNIKINILDASYNEAKKWYNSLGIGRKK